VTNVIPIKGPRARRQKCQQITTVEQINKSNAAFWATPEANATARSIAELQSAVAAAYGAERVRRIKQSGAGAAVRRLHGDKKRQLVRDAAAQVLKRRPGIQREVLARAIHGAVKLSVERTKKLLKELKIPGDEK
jgi:DNA invertase Pin-like site-specific DNA recombinase